jgi:hypothetical protein
MRQRFLPLTAGDLHGLPERVFAPHRWLASMGPVLFEASPLIILRGRLLERERIRRR